jgi:hypothetical protein
LTRLTGTVAATLALFLSACGSNMSNVDPPLPVPNGQWGGQNIDLQVTDMGAAVTFRCGAKGNISQPLTVDSFGRFDRAGTYDPVLVAGGPRPARYVGSLSGSTMIVTASTDGGMIGTFSLTKGRAPSFDVCNLSR